MTTVYVECVVRNKIATITLNNPPLNVFKMEMTGQLDAVLEDLRRDENVRAVLLKGAGRAFCAGSDISEFEHFYKPGNVVEMKLRRQNAVFQKLEAFPKPVVAALHGLAFGGGLEIALCCDLIVVEETCRLALPEMRLGVFPSSGGPYRTVRRIGPARTKQLIFLTEPIDAKTAFDWGLIDRLASKDEVIQVAEALASEMAKRPQRAFSLCKTLIADATRLSTADLIARSLDASDQVFASADCREGVRAFFAKEEPDFGHQQNDTTI
ncbi:MAG: 3-hydroxypropionyl-CoA dehydratase [Gammaproteobacteria bacterium]|mgnify:FL=1|jgi:enoyl-CoA hydratase/carnithine racemase|uniref:enoyl-CoA hydratase/isomerase family protein n=1 Tax=Hwanghaeella sp. 1Z406 TaxID=3402811 RepID=UPI000C9028F5|nr:3-hydroxypropionyl-CoA dehydratase [Gammaproteobacteria bacterium]|tara:strand:+ start:1601 stop:2401 length:801 start_codon:yes stop_codon:yes gene_type:complete